MPVGGLSHRVDLDLGSILVLEDLVQVDEYVRCFIPSTIPLEAQFLSHTQSGLLAQSGVKVDGGGDNRTGVFSCNFFDVHTTLVGCDKNDTLGNTVVEYGDVVFMGRVAAFCEHDCVAYPSSCTGLLGDELVANHLAGVFFSLLGTTAPCKWRLLEKQTAYLETMWTPP